MADPNGRRLRGLDCGLTGACQQQDQGLPSGNKMLHKSDLVLNHNNLDSKVIDFLKFFDTFACN
jgi:hypothetical protein